MAGVPPHPDRADYTAPGAWERLAGLLGGSLRPVPTGRCGHVVCTPDWSWTYRTPDVDLWLVVSGRGTLLTAGEQHRLGPGDLLVLRPGDRGRVVQDPRDSLTVTYLHFAWTRPGSGEVVTVEADLLPSRLVRLPRPSAVAEPLLRTVRLVRGGDRFDGAEAAALLVHVLAEVYRQDAAARGHGRREADPRVLAAMTHIREHPSRRPSLEEVAAEVGVSPTYLSRLFRRDADCSFRAFTVAARMERARFLLEETTLRVGEVARELGYGDAVLFSRQFRAHTGVAPSTYRRPG